MTDAVLAKAGGLPKDALADLPKLGAELQRFGDALRERELARTPPCRRKRRNCGRRFRRAADQHRQAGEREIRR